MTWLVDGAGHKASSLLKEALLRGSCTPTGGVYRWSRDRDGVVISVQQGLLLSSFQAPNEGRVLDPKDD